MTHWTHLMTAAEIEERHALTARIDPAYAEREQQFYSSRTVPQLDVIAAQAWRADELDYYQLARSYAALKREG